MGLITALVVGFIVFILVQYLAPGLSIWVALFFAGFIAGLLAEGILKGLFVGFVISVIGVFIVMYFYGGTTINANSSDIIGTLAGLAGVGSIILSSVAGLLGGGVRRYKFRK